MRCYNLCLIEEERGLYGMRLNKGKCEYLRFGQAGMATFKDGRSISPHPELNIWDAFLTTKRTATRRLIKEYQTA